MAEFSVKPCNSATKDTKKLLASVSTFASREFVLVEVNRRRNRKSLLYTLIRDRNGREKSWFLQGNACQGNSSKLQSLIAGVCHTFTGMQSWYCDKRSLQNMSISPCEVSFFKDLTALPKRSFSSPCSFFIGIYKNTVSKIFSEKDEFGKTLYKELHIMWKILGSKAQILKYGMTHLQNKQMNKR